MAVCPGNTELILNYAQLIPQRLLRCTFVIAAINLNMKTVNVEACKAKNPRKFSKGFADRTGLEPATSAVTGRHSNQLNYRSIVGVANVIEIAIQAKTKMPDG